MIYSGNFINLYVSPTTKKNHLQHDTSTKTSGSNDRSYKDGGNDAFFSFPHLKKKTVGCCIHYHPNLST